VPASHTQKTRLTLFDPVAEPSWDWKQLHAKDCRMWGLEKGEKGNKVVGEWRRTLSVAPRQGTAIVQRARTKCFVKPLEGTMTPVCASRYLLPSGVDQSQTQATLETNWSMRKWACSQKGNSLKWINLGHEPSYSTSCWKCLNSCTLQQWDSPSAPNSDTRGGEESETWELAQLGSRVN
jgi:hypothetical protein